MPTKTITKKPEVTPICHVCGKEKKPYTIFINNCVLSMITHYMAREDGEICERCNKYYAMTGEFKDATDHEFKIAEKASWFSYKMLAWWEKDKKMDCDGDIYNNRDWPGTHSIYKWYVNKFKNIKEAEEFVRLIGLWWERDTPNYEKPEYNPRCWDGTAFIAAWCRNHLNKN